MARKSKRSAMATNPAPFMMGGMAGYKPPPPKIAPKVDTSPGPRNIGRVKGALAMAMAGKKPGIV